MNITQNWRVNGINVVDENGFTDVIKSVGYHVDYWLEGKNRAHGISGKVEIPSSFTDSHKEFSSLTQDDVIAWVKSILGETTLASMEAEAITYFTKVEQSIANKERKVTAPWEPTPIQEQVKALQEPSA